MQAYNITNEKFSTICNLQAALMFQWYMSVDVEHVKILAPIAFLMQMGKVVIATEVKSSDYFKLFQEELDKAETIEEVEVMFTGMTSSKIGALLFEHWCFDEMFIITMEYLDDIENAPEYVKIFINALNIVRKAVNIKEQLSDASIEKAREMVKELGLNDERFLHTAMRLQEK